ASQFRSQESLSSLGLDSMMAIEVKHRIEGALKVDVSVLELLQEITIAQLSTRILASLQLGASAASGDAASSIGEIQQLIEHTEGEDLESLLAELEQEPEGENLESLLAELKQTPENEDLESLLAELEQTLDNEANV
ncbi:MAG: acyl carrier protein, partial [Ktedonobacteraceae bacterium]